MNRKRIFSFSVSEEVSKFLDDACHQRFVAQEFRCNCSVGFQSKRTLIAARNPSGDQLAESRSERRVAAHDLLGEAREMFGGVRTKREEMPDLRILRSRGLHRLDE